MCQHDVHSNQGDHCSGQMICQWQAVHCPADDGAVLSVLDENAGEEMAAEDIADVTVLRARVKHLEMQQSLMDRELDSMSDLARQSETQLRCAPR